MLTFEFQKFTPFEQMKELVPQNCLVNLYEVVPGLNTDNSKLPKPRENFNAPLQVQPVKTMQKKTIYLHDMKLVCDIEFEKQFEAFLRDVVTIENGDLENTVQMVSIRKRTIHVGVHNTWRNLNETERMVILDEPDR